VPWTSPGRGILANMVYTTADKIGRPVHLMDRGGHVAAELRRRGKETMAQLVGAAAGFILVVMLSACTMGGDVLDWTVTTDSGPGGPVVRRVLPPGADSSSLTWQAAEDLRIGTGMGDTAYTFSSLSALDVDEVGRIIAVDRLAQAIRLFDSAGRLLRTVGRKGQGPGEFINASAVRVLDDGRVLVYDPGNNRITFLDSALTVRAERTRPVAGMVFPWPGLLLDGDEVLDWTVAFPDDPQPTGAPSLIAWVPVVWGDMGIDSFAPIRYRPSYTQFPGLFKPWASSVRVATTADGDLWFAHAAEYTLYRRNLAGDTLAIVSVDVDPVDVTSHERDSVIADYGQHGMRLEDRDVERSKPVVLRLLTDDVRRLFVAVQYGVRRPGRDFDIFSPEGFPLGSLRLPEPVELDNPPPVIRGSNLYAVIRNELDVPFIVRFVLHAPSVALSGNPDG
jgi:hypothetical protein